MKRLGSTFIFILTTCFSFGQILYADSNDPVSAANSRKLTIQEAVQMALTHSPEILLAETQVKRTEEVLKETRSLNLPQAEMSTGYAYNNGFPMGAPSIFKIGGSQAILNSKNANLVRESKEAVKAGQLGTDLSRNELASKAITVYYQLHQARLIIALSSSRLDRTRKQQKILESSLEAGKVRSIELTMAKTAAAAVQQQLLVAQEQAKIAEAELQELTGLPGTTSIQTLDPVLESAIYDLDAETIFQQSIKSNPEILRAESAIKVKEFHAAAEKGENHPKLDAVTEYSLFSRANNYEDYYRRFERNNFLVGFSLRIPLFNGFRTSARVAQSNHEADEERYKLQKIKSDLKINIQRGLSALRIARGASDVAAGDLAAAKEMLEINNVLLESGRISMKEAEEAQLQLQQKELSKLEADQTLFQRKLELLRITGNVLSTLH
jgi:outer membrane protein